MGDLFVRLDSLGFPVIAEHSELPDSYREYGLDLFRRGIARIIVSARSLIEGFNVPAVAREGGKPEHIVLTREDYLRYDLDRGALAGLVQGLLITRHMLFVGFSMSDDNFHRIADEVRRAVQRTPFGTCLSVAGSQLLREVWEKDLAWVELGHVPHSPRKLEFLLDRLAARTVPSADHLFDAKYEATLSPADKRFRDKLNRLAQFVFGTPEHERQNAAWVEVEKLLTSLHCNRFEK